MIFEIYGWEGPFDLDVERFGEVASYSVRGLDWPTYRERRSAGGLNGFEMTKLPALRSTVIEVNRLRDMVVFEEFLHDVFEGIEAGGDDYLVVDLRRSVGGNSVMAEDLLDYVAVRPYRLHGVKRVRMSRYNEMFFPEDEGTRHEIRTFESELQKPGDTPFRFRGKMLVLTSNLTSGAAAQFAAAVKDLKLGTLIGEETGDPPSCWTDPYTVTLPNSGLALDVSSTYATRPNEDETFVEKGVAPDVRVTMTREDLRDGVDPWMERAKALISADIAAVE